LTHTKKIVIISLNRVNGKNSLNLSLINDFNNKLNDIEKDDKINASKIKRLVDHIDDNVELFSI
jgi:enoyl-CoA hydratase/carnithine racemase